MRWLHGFAYVSKQYYLTHSARKRTVQSEPGGTIYGAQANPRTTKNQAKAKSQKNAVEKSPELPKMTAGK